MQIQMLVELTYDAHIMHGDDPDAIEWFEQDILGDPGLILHSNEIGDELGTVRVISIVKENGDERTKH